MKIIKIDKINRKNELIEVLLEVWEGSVKATHLFLSEKKIEKIKKCAKKAIKEIEILIVALDDNIPIAFMGVQDKKIEMLFVRADKRNKGIGKKLIQFGIKEFSIEKVDVNEQNPSARGFYEKMGFRVYDRKEFDSEGNPYPLLLMKRV